MGHAARTSMFTAPYRGRKAVPEPRARYAVTRWPVADGLQTVRGRRVADHGTRRCRVAAEYSSICAVRSRGYEISTSTISPAALVTGSSRGMTNPVYDGR